MAVMERIDADLALGVDAEMIGELEKLIAADLLQERLREQLMRALYRADRRADALKVYSERSRRIPRRGQHRDGSGARWSHAVYRADGARYMRAEHSYGAVP